MQVTKNYITLLGLTDDRRKVVLADNRGNKEGATNNGYIFDVNATGFTMMNLTVVQLLQPGLRVSRRPREKPQDALAGHHPGRRDPDAEGDKHVYSHVAFLSRLDTTFIRTTRSYFTNVFVEGTDDFIGGGAVGVWENSEVYFPTGNGVMSASGIAFIHTVFRAARGLEFYKGFRNPVALIRCTMPVNTPQSPVAWMVWKAAVRQNLYSLTYQTKDAKGHPAVLYDSIVGPHTFTLSRELSAREAAAFNPWNLLRATPGGGADDWDPAGVREKYANDGSDVFRMAVAGPPPAGDIPGGGPFVSRAVSPTVRTDRRARRSRQPCCRRAPRTRRSPGRRSQDWSSLSSTAGNSVTDQRQQHDQPRGVRCRARPRRPTASTSHVHRQRGAEVHRPAEVHQRARGRRSAGRQGCGPLRARSRRQGRPVAHHLVSVRRRCLRQPAQGGGQPRQPAAAQLHADRGRCGQVSACQHPAEAQHQRSRPGGDSRPRPSRSLPRMSRRPPINPDFRNFVETENRTLRERRVDRDRHLDFGHRRQPRQRLRPARQRTDGRGAGTEDLARPGARRAARAPGIPNPMPRCSTTTTRPPATCR